MWVRVCYAISIVCEVISVKYGAVDDVIVCSSSGVAEKAGNANLDLRFRCKCLLS